MSKANIITKQGLIELNFRLQNGHEIVLSNLMSIQEAHDRLSEAGATIKEKGLVFATLDYHDRCSTHNFLSMIGVES